MPRTLYISDTAPTIWRARAMARRLEQNGVAYHGLDRVAADPHGMPGKVGRNGFSMFARAVERVIDRAH